MPSRFIIILGPARFTTVLQMINTGKAVAILHNMAIECTRGSFSAQWRMKAAAEVQKNVAELQGQRQGPENSDVGLREQSRASCFCQR